MNCLKCETDLPEYIGKGRPPTYCGKGCRRAAEYELRRLDRQIGGLEDSARSWRDPGKPWMAAQRKQGTEFVEKELAVAEARLRVLLSGGASDV